MTDDDDNILFLVKCVSDLATLRDKMVTAVVRIE